MTTLEMEIALMRELNIRKNIIVPNVSFGMYFKGHGVLHECDLLCLSKSGYATEIEIKISKSDLLKDKLKGHNHYHKAIKNLYFAVPEKLKELAEKEIPEKAGLYVVKRNKYNKKYYSVDKIKQAKPRTDCIKWDDGKRINLLRLGCLRILNLKTNILKYKK